MIKIKGEDPRKRLLSGRCSGAGGRGSLLPTPGEGGGSENLTEPEETGVQRARLLMEREVHRRWTFPQIHE